MKTTLVKTGIIGALFFAGLGNAQQFPIDNLNPRDQISINAFENPKDSTTVYDGIKVRVGGAFALQFQGIQHENNATPNINPTTGVNTNQLIDQFLFFLCKSAPQNKNYIFFFVRNFFNDKIGELFPT